MKKTRFICFSGPDGTGKTTHSKFLLEELRKDGEQVEYIHIFSKEGSFLNRLVHSFKVFSRDGKERSKQNSLTSYRTTMTLVLKSLITLFDSWATYWYLKLKHNHRIVICDRYFYDNIVYIAASETKLAPLILRFSSLVPKPDIAIFLHAKPEILSERRKGQTLKSMRQVDQIFKSLVAKENLISISTETTAETVDEQLKMVSAGISRQHINKIGRRRE